LRRNRLILKSISPKGQPKIGKEFLLGTGFELKYYTHQYITKAKGNVYYFCYEYGYLKLEDDKFLVVKWQDFMDKNQVRD